MQRLRTKFQNMRDAAAAQASNALSQQRQQGSLVDVSKQRLGFLEEVTPRLQTVRVKLQQAKDELEDLEGSQSGLGAVIGRGIAQTFGSGDKTNRQAQELADKRLEVTQLEDEFRDLNQMINTTLRDFTEDISGQSSFNPVQT